MNLLFMLLSLFTYIYRDRHFQRFELLFLNSLYANLNPKTRGYFP